MADSPTIDRLTELWQRVLKVPAIGPEMNFFEIGGDSHSAIAIFREITKIYGRELPAVTIFQAPTIIALASLLATPAQLLHCPPLLLMKSGAENPPIFFAHGLREDAMQIFPVIKHIDLNHAIYGTQARGIDGVQPPLDSVGDMADFHLQAIRKIQLQGPYFLIGYSFGGLVMLEIAQRLSSEGQKIGFLAMLDSYPHRAHLQLAQQFFLFIQSAKSRIRIHSLRRRLRVPKSGRRSAEHENHSALNQIKQDIYQGELSALRRYQPRFYPGKLHFVQAEIPSYFPANARKVWTNLVADFELEIVPGNHIEMIRIHYKTVAELLTRNLSRAFRENMGE